MEEDQSVGAHKENAELEGDQQDQKSESGQTMPIIEAEAHPNLPSLERRLSEVPDPSAGATREDRDITILDQGNVSSQTAILGTQYPDQRPASSNHVDVISTRSGPISPPSEVIENVPVDPNADHIPDLIEDEFQQEYAPRWPLNHSSDGAFGGSQQCPPESTAESEADRIQAFAKIEFVDGDFYMTTYAVELGRDLEAARLEREREVERGMSSDVRSKKRSTSRSGSMRSDRARRESDLENGIASELGGAVANHRKLGKGKKERRHKSGSWSSSSKQLSRKSSIQSGALRTDYNAIAVASLMDSSAHPNGFGTGASLPSPDLIPLIPLRPLAHLEGRSQKGISRKHIKIAFDFDEKLFQAEVLGQNGVFIDEVFYAQGKLVPLVNGSVIQIADVTFRFILPDVPQGETGAEIDLGSDPTNGGMMSFDMGNSSPEESQEESQEANDDDTNTMVKQEEGEEQTITRTRGRGKKKTEAPPPPPPKRKGPGRPPKNGIISKREQALLAKQAKEEAKAKAEGRVVASSGQGKGKDSKEIKDTKNLQGEESNRQPNGKRKYTKRKRAGGTEDQQAIRDSTEHTESIPPEQAYATILPPKPLKEKKPAKPPRSPSPVFDESKMTQEQLAKPQSSYVVLIHEALTNSKTGQMSLPQIYRAIERRYPFYKLRVQTQGWQSSVRHNLSQHPAFRKIERDGKGWMWGLVPEISIEKEKKRRATPPPPSQPHYYPPNPIMQHPYPYPNVPPQNGHIPPAPYGHYPGMPPGRMPYPPPPRPGFPLPLVNAQSESTYRSPYQSTPPPAPTASMQQPEQLPTTNGINGSHGTLASQSHSEESNNKANLAGSNKSPPPHLREGSAPPTTNGNHEQDVNQTVSKFKTALINTMDDKAHAEAMINSAVNRVLGIQTKSGLPGDEEDPNEKTIMATFSKMLGDLSKKNMDARKHDSHPSAPTTNGDTAAESRPKPSENSSATAVAAEEAAKIALADDESASIAIHEKTEKQDPNGGLKRPLEAENGTTNDDVGQPELKRVASGTVKV